ncbi:MAG: hypothetical protein HQ483_07695, partial [Rhodospirillales bacterium]|nr:hypothetical protein [Rhodospirillales bacterium]
MRKFLILVLFVSFAMNATPARAQEPVSTGWTGGQIAALVIVGATVAAVTWYALAGSAAVAEWWAIEAGAAEGGAMMAGEGAGAGAAEGGAMMPGEGAGAGAAEGGAMMAGEGAG